MLLVVWLVGTEQRPLVQAGWQQLGQVDGEQLVQVGQKLCVGWQAVQAEWNPFCMHALPYVCYEKSRFD